MSGSGDTPAGVIFNPFAGAVDETQAVREITRLCLKFSDYLKRADQDSLSKRCPPTQPRKRSLLQSRPATTPAGSLTEAKNSRIFLFSLGPVEEDLVFGRKLTLGNELYERMKRCSETAGYATPEEFALHVLEKEVDRLLTGGAERDVVTDEGSRKESIQDPGSID